MENYLNYPIKYAILELKVPGGYNENYRDITVSFIVSKCYVINQTTKYYPDGKSKISYNVVFPYSDFFSFQYNTSIGFSHQEKENTPIYNWDGDCLNANKVLNIFDTFEEASIYANEENIELKRTIVSQHFYKIDEYKKKLKEFDETLYMCKCYEQFISEKTKCMTISNEIIDIKILKRK